MRVVLDTNVWVSALLWRSTPYRLLQTLERRDASIVTTPWLLRELRTVLHRPKFARRLDALSLTVDDVIAAVLEHVEVFADAPPPVPPMVTADPDDDRLLLCAQTSAAAMIVTGDHHLLRRRHHLGIPIVTPTQALATTRAGWKR